VEDQQTAQARRFADANAGREPPVYFSPATWARLEGLYRAALAAVACSQAQGEAPPPKPGSKGGGAKRREPEAAELLVARHPPAWDGSLATIASLIDGLGAAAAAAAAAGPTPAISVGASGGPGLSTATSGVTPPAPSLAPQSSTVAALGTDRGPSPLPGTAPRSSIAAASTGGGGGAAAAAAASANATAAAAAAANGAALREAAAVLSVRLEVSAGAAAVPDCQRRLLEAAVRDQVLELAGGLPAIIADARHANAAAPAGGAVQGHGRHAGGRHAGASSAADAVAAAAAAAVSAAVSGAVSRSISSIERGVAVRRRAVAALLDGYSGAARAQLAAALEQPQQAGVGDAEAAAWRAHAAERARAWLQQ
jgi:hypothetical protein